METELIIRNLSNLLPANLNYSERSNAFLTNGYVSTANNVYFNSVRFAEGIVIKEDVGQGYARTFLNGIRIYSLESRTLLADKTFHCCFYSKDKVFQEAKTMLLDIVSEAVESNERTMNKKEAEKAIDKILNKSLNQNQFQVLQQQARYMLPK